LSAVLAEYVKRHNLGVRTRDFSELLELLDEQAVLTFHGLPLGPFATKRAIAGAFAERGPDEELVLLDESGTYAWQTNPSVAAGHIRIESHGGKITAIDVTALG
jgi:hypothetical protein